ncbi:MAG: ATP-binding cassette domain-containing protein [Candidatus Zixiibacteriota bacterium]
MDEAPGSRDIVLETIALTRKVNSAEGARCIVNEFSFQFCRRHVYCLIGLSGAGKSSLLRLLNRLDDPTSGQILFHGVPHIKYSPPLLRRKISYLFQLPYLFDGTVRDNIRFGRQEISKSDIARLAERVHLSQNMLDSPSKNLSGGERQRVALARALATEPEVLLLDEPTSSLDPSHTEAIEALILELTSSTDLSALVVTHDPQQAIRIGGETLLMADGHLVEHGPPKQLLEHPETEAGRQYVRRERS